MTATKICFVCKASTQTGMGHLIRSRSLANKLVERRPGLRLNFHVIGEKLVGRLLTGAKFDYQIHPTEEDFPYETLPEFELCFFDMISISDSLFDDLKARARVTASISPIFNKMTEVDLLFNRTKYLQSPTEAGKPKVYAGLEYTIIQDHCRPISTATYESNLELTQFPIAISMGGGDAANKTLMFLRSLKNCSVPATFWVMLGEGYKYSYDALIQEIKRDSGHEIILAKTNWSMWQILQNCILAILPGGITTYEAAYAGLPTINLLEQAEKYFLIQELVENEVSLYQGEINADNLQALNRTIEQLYHDRRQLLQMHMNTKGMIGTQSAAKIIEQCELALEAAK